MTPLFTILHLALCLLPFASSALDSLYQTGDYERVAELAPLFLADSARSAADSSAVNQTYAFALVALGRTDEAAAVFRRLLLKHPNLTLDPEAVSPKIRAVFESVKAQTAMPTPLPKVLPPETVYLRRPVPLSVLIPGLRQIQTGRPAAGYALAGATALSLAGLVFSHVEYNRARAEYLSASAPQDITDRYRTADSWSHRRIVLSGTAAALWVLSLVTALRTP